MNKTVNLWLFGVAIILFGASLFLNISNIVITNETLVLAFVGILATFIVVGNYAQVTEIRNDTNKQIKDLESSTQIKIDELNSLYSNFSEVSEKITKIEKNTYYNAAEAYRLYGIYTSDKKHYKISVVHMINSIYCYNLAGKETSLIEKLLDSILKNLKPGYWDKDSTDRIIIYTEILKKVKEFPDTYTQKKEIIHLLEKYQEEDNKI